MGNSASCSPSLASARVIKVVSRDGRVEEFRRPVKAAELMLENPRHFVCDSGDLKVGQRVPGLTADEDLEPRRLYLLLPMDMLFSVLTNEEMSYLSHGGAIGTSKNGASANIAKIFPVLGDFCLFPTSTSEAKPAKEAESTERFARQRSWQPALDTIMETPSRI